MALTKIGSIGINTGIQFAGVTTIATLNGSDSVLSVGGTVNFTSDVSIGGSVSIGGTLTYEDVTNVDSVGIITARSNILVGSGITLSPDGDVFTTGISTFGGDVTILQSAGTDAILSINEGTTSNPLRIMQTATEAKIQTVASQPFNIRSQSGSGSTGYLAFWTRDDERVRITSDGKVLVGTSASRNVGGRSANLQIQGTDGASSALSITRNSANSSGPHIDFAKTRAGSLTDNSPPNDGESLGEITFSGGDGTDTVSMGVRIRATLDEGNGAVGVNSMPGKLSFQTSSAGNQNPTERFAINSAGVSTFFGDLTIDCRATDSVSADLFLRAGEGSQAQIYMIADEGDDGGDNWRISAMSGFSNRLIFYNSASGSYTDVLSFQTNGTIRPGTTNQSDLGSSSYRWANIYTNDLNLSNKGSTNKVDGTWGDYTIQEGETDLYLINNRSGKKYKFNLTEVS